MQFNLLPPCLILPFRISFVTVSCREERARVFLKWTGFTSRTCHRLYSTTATSLLTTQLTSTLVLIETMHRESSNALECWREESGFYPTTVYMQLERFKLSTVIIIVMPLITLESKFFKKTSCSSVECTTTPVRMFTKRTTSILS